MAKHSGRARNNGSKLGSRPVAAVMPRLDELVGEEYNPLGGADGRAPVRTRTPMPSDADRVVSYPPVSRLPRWMLYAGAGAALGAVVLAYAAAVEKPVPELLREAWQRVGLSQPKPGGFVPPTIKIPTSAPVVSQYRKQALEEIAAIGQTEPTLAQLLQNTDWFSNGVDKSEAEFVAKIRKYVADGNYAVGAITHNDSSVTSVLVLSADKDKREQSMAKTQQYLPEVSQLLKIEYKKILLIVDADIGVGGAGFTGVNLSVSSGLPHELVHMVYEFSAREDFPLGQTPVWFDEGGADFVSMYVLKGDDLIEGSYNARADYFKSNSSKVEPLSKIREREKDGTLNQTLYALGFMFLKDYKDLVGYQNFWGALLHVHDVKVARGVTTSPIVSHKDLEAILEQHVPQDKLPQFRQLYQERVYGLPTTQP